MKHLTDEQIVAMAQASPLGNEYEEFLVQVKYKDKAIYVAREFENVKGHSLEDRASICKIELLEAVRTYRPGSGSKFLSWAKYLMRNAMVELVREQDRAKEIPIHKRRSIDDPVEQDDGEVCIIDIVPGDGEAEVLEGLMAEVASDEVKDRVWQRFCDLMEDADTEAQGRIRGSILTFTRAVFTGDEYADVRDLLGRVGDQPALLTLAPERGSSEAQALARRVFSAYAAFLMSVLEDKVDGYDTPEIASRATFRMQLDVPGFVATLELVLSTLAVMREEAAEAA